MPRVVHFELAADDPERVTTFYSEVFGWEVSKWDGPMDYWMIKTGEQGEMGIDGGIMRREPESAATVNTIDVPSFDEYATRIVTAGGTQVLPKMAVPGIGYMAYFKDTEGTVFGIMQSDPSAE